MYGLGVVRAVDLCTKTTQLILEDELNEITDLLLLHFLNPEVIAQKQSRHVQRIDSLISISHM